MSKLKNKAFVNAFSVPITNTIDIGDTRVGDSLSIKWL